uniref:Uroplakin-3a-like n=1 Tax=Erpetoichthys calabaricus TaxID=27687 RepID=A0A8C4S5L3_ERPCA
MKFCYFAVHVEIRFCLIGLVPLFRLNKMQLLICGIILIWFGQNSYSANNPVVLVQPQLASPLLLPYNPTQTTVSLEKPFCVFDTLNPSSNANVDVYVVLSSVASSTFTPWKNYKGTNGGSTGPYRAASFKLPNCASPAKLSDLSIPSKLLSTLNEYLIQIGNNSACVNDPAATDLCNGPLGVGAAYRFKFLLIDGALVKGETSWSEPVFTRQALDPADLDTWIGKRTGSSVVIASVLSSVTFLLLCLLIPMSIYELVHRVKGKWLSGCNHKPQMVETTFTMVIRECHW